ncbi:MAG: AMP-binding protein [Phycisphaerae bacterium]|nr:AMP-binding protein [Phycisphaerae bacterium]MCZ2400523.1 AMP-binding protein [Phycisphaerae bacterium]
MHPLLDRFEANVAARGEALAVADAGLALSYAALRAVAGGLAGQIERASGRRRIGIMTPTSAAGATAILAGWYAGRTPVPLNFLLSDAELAAIGRDADLDLVVTVEPLADKARATGAAPLVLSARHTLVPRPIPPAPAVAEDTGVILYTSGTTGAPKGVCLSFQNLVSNADACIAHARIDPDRVFLSVLPQFHSFGFTAMTVVPLLLGATAWYLPRFSPAAVLNCIAERRVNVFMAVASMYAALLRQRETPPHGLASMQLAVSGGEPLPATVAAAFRERFGIELLEGYGLTETSPVVSLNVPWAHRPGSVGRALPGIDVRAVDDAGAALPPGGEGELVVRGHCVMQGYHNRPEDTAAVVRGGALHTGDIGRVDADGYIHITGRAREMMIVGGENVFPAEIEAVLLEHPAVADTGVIGAPDALRGESPVAFVVLREGAAAEPAELRRFCRDRLAGYKLPREVRIVPDLPRGPTGKVLRRALRERL